MNDIVWIFMTLVVCVILIWVKRNELETKVLAQTEELREQQKKNKELFVQTVTALSEAIDAKDRYTSGHSKRVAEYSRMIAKRMGKTKEEQEEIYYAGLLHDVGKIRVPREIISKTDKLNNEELDAIRVHPITGCHILRGISGCKLIRVGAKYHHERYDGKGYPNGLSGKKIPEVARILAVADAYDAMTSDRSYRKALEQKIVRAEIEKEKGLQFDPEIADIMLQMIDEDKNFCLRQEGSLNKTILVVDDDVMSAKLITHIMRDEPMYKIVPAYSGEEALKIMEKQTFDLILLDYVMPGKDGLEVFRLIREKWKTPVALMTGDRSHDTINRLVELGCDDYVTKPLQPSLIKEAIYGLSKKTAIEYQAW